MKTDYGERLPQFCRICDTVSPLLSALRNFMMNASVENIYNRKGMNSNEK